MHKPHVKLFVEQTLQNFKENEMTMRDLFEWYKDQQGDPDFQMFNIRDALYVLEGQGVAERWQGENDTRIYWRLKL